MNTKLIIPFLILALLAGGVMLGCNDDNSPTAALPDYRPPSVEWIAPSPDADLSGETTLLIAASDDDEVANVAVYLNGKASDDWRVAGHADTLYSFTWDTRDYSDDQYTLEARAWDASGNLGTSPALLVRVANDTTAQPEEDRTPPVIAWMSPQPGDTLQSVVNLRFQIIDESPIDTAIVMVNGRQFQTRTNLGAFYNGDEIWDTSESDDGIYLIQIKAMDSARNVAYSEVIRFTVWNSRPRVIWVPDDFETIQEAINFSSDFDTIRLRPGTYREGLRLMGKNIWLESEEGPEVTMIDGTGWNDGIWAADETESKLTVIRGITIYGEVTGIQGGAYSNLIILNCIFKGIWEPFNDDTFMAIWTGKGVTQIYNCVFDGCSDGIVSNYCTGRLENSIIVNGDIGYYYNAVWKIWFTHDWNLFWNNVTDIGNDEPNVNEIFEDPQFGVGYQLLEGSPAMNAGNPNIFDLDGTNSDIGIYGGPYAYTAP